MLTCCVLGLVADSVTVRRGSTTSASRGAQGGGPSADPDDRTPRLRFKAFIARLADRDSYPMYLKVAGSLIRGVIVVQGVASGAGRPDPCMWPQRSGIHEQGTARHNCGL